ncbi:MAG: thioesterase [Lentisphaerae bacterium GWF2_45_14]|nr:MAG: thioesterase [Lentisphaerae bacterium GWF2_45_14]
MARIKLEVPEKFIFSTQIDVRISDINYGGHLGNDSVLSIIHEARMRFLRSVGFSETDIGDNCGLIMGDAAIVFKAEAFYGDKLEIKIAIQDMAALGFDMFYLITKVDSGQETCRAKTGMVFFDYASKKVRKAPEQFLSAVRQA